MRLHNTRTPLYQYFNLSSRVNFVCPVVVYTCTTRSNVCARRLREVVNWRFSPRPSFTAVYILRSPNVVRIDGPSCSLSSQCRHNQQNMAVLCRHVVTSMAREHFWRLFCGPSARVSALLRGLTDKTLRNAGMHTRRFQVMFWKSDFNVHCICRL